MELNFNCFSCNVSQAVKVMNILDLDRDTKERMMRDVLAYLSVADYTKCNPEILGLAWEVMLKHTGNPDPYETIKKYYNSEVMKMRGELEALIQKSDDRFNTALRVAIAGNLIDFAAGYKFNLETLKNKIRDTVNSPLTIDHSDKLYGRLKAANTVLYLGDNCGEICLDKLFIKYIKEENPGIKVYYGVKGRAVVNDVTLDDAEFVGMRDVAEVISNGDISLGTVIDRVSEDFRGIFYSADVVISKGQGNFESLSGADRSNIFYLFMVKCEPVAALLGVGPMSVLCAGNSIKEKNL